ncbi:MAG: DNA replication and repair protein RecF [Flavobacteriales bacterium]
MSYITHLNIQHLRNIEALELSPNPQLNFFHGQNGAGKTSILEAVQLLSTARSFRSSKTRTLIQHDKDSLTVFARIERSKLSHTLGLVKSAKGETLIRVDSRSIYSSSELAALLPVLKLDADTFSILEGSPSHRRSLLEWLMFHVEHSYHDLWKGYQSCLKQRNILLRRGKIDYLEIGVWDVQLVAFALKIEKLRQGVFERFRQVLLPYIADFGFIKSDLFELRYINGWHSRAFAVSGDITEADYNKALKANFERDCKSGFTNIGSHRFDLMFLDEGRAVSDVLSRGQKKTLLIAIISAIANMCEQASGEKPIFLLDDLSSELDENNLNSLFSWLIGFKAQCFITSVQPTAFTNLDCDLSQSNMFHVKHGEVTLKE